MSLTRFLVACCRRFSLLCTVTVWAGSRLNAMLGGSVLHPRGGGYALAVLVSPALLATICLSGCASVWLYAILVEEQVSRLVNLTHRPGVRIYTRTHQAWAWVPHPLLFLPPRTKSAALGGESTRGLSFFQASNGPEVLFHDGTKTSVKHRQIRLSFRLPAC